MPEPSLTQRIAIAPSDYRVAIISPEWGTTSSALYTGGLGILAFDWGLEAADRGWPILGIGLGYHKGFKQIIGGSGWQTEEDIDFDPLEHGFLPLEKRVKTNVSGRDVLVGGYIKHFEGRRSTFPLVLLSTNFPENTSSWDRGLTARVYDDGNGNPDYYKTAQFRILASAVRLLQENGYNIQIYHLNDSHGAFVILELMNQGLSPEQIRQMVRFTTHTPIAAAFYHFNFNEVKGALPHEAYKLEPFVNDYGNFEIARLIVKYSGAVSAVSQKHAEVSSGMDEFRGLSVIPITNGVHLPSWTHPAKLKVYQDSIGDVPENPMLLHDSSSLNYRAFRQAHEAAQKELFDLIKDRTGVQFDQGALTIGFARRFANYKRGNLMFSNSPEHLARVLQRNGQIIFAGKAHPNDGIGKEILQSTYQNCQLLMDKYGVKAVVIPDYSRDVAEILVRGIDLWINNPRRGEEASGTSGMKVALNGGINFSVLDGWWAEAYDGMNGWSIAPQNGHNDDAVDSHSIVDSLEHQIIPEFHDDGFKYRRTKSLQLGSRFNTARNFGEVINNLYGLPLEEIVKQERAA